MTLAVYSAGRQMVRSAALLVLLSLVGTSAVGLACGLACGASHQTAAAGCHDHGAAGSGPALTATHACDHESSIDAFTMQTQRGLSHSASVATVLTGASAVDWLAVGDRWEFPPGAASSSRFRSSILRI